MKWKKKKTQKTLMVGLELAAQWERHNWGTRSYMSLGLTGKNSDFGLNVIKTIEALSKSNMF